MAKLGIHFSHDSTIAYSPKPGIYRSYELERLTKKRYFSIDMYQLFTEKLYCEETTEFIFKRLSEEIKKEFGEEGLIIEKITVDQKYPEVNKPELNPGGLPIHKHIDKVLRDYFHVQEGVQWEMKCHHMMHSLSAFFQSPFEEALVISFDAGGLAENENFANYFVGAHIKRNGQAKYVFSNRLHLCSLYNAFPYLTRDVRGNINSVPGKAMGLSGYGAPSRELYKKLKPIIEAEEWINIRVYKDGTGELDCDYLYDVISRHFEVPKYEKLDFNNSSILLATVQQLFEDVFIDSIKSTVYKLNLPIVISGGGALNVLNNTRVKNEFKLPVFIPCNPNDTGTAIGGLLEDDKPKDPVDLRFSNWDLFDRDKLNFYVKERKAEIYNIREISEYIRSGKIIGVVRGRSECGPRALGNRSIICDPSIKGMKDVLNEKVKHREHYRPFAPMVLQDEANEYFNWDNSPAPHMSFSSLVRSKYSDKLKEITHFDSTARIQTITLQDNPWYFYLLNEMKKTGLPVLLNTSFNILGKPILNTIEDALNVLDNTELDYVIVEDYIFKK